MAKPLDSAVGLRKLQGRLPYPPPLRGVLYKYGVSWEVEIRYSEVEKRLGCFEEVMRYEVEKRGEN